MELNKIIQHNVSTGLPLPDKSIDCCVTSPPYWGLRDYGSIGQLGLERTPEEFIENMVNVFMEVHRSLKAKGTLWLIIGDSYAGNNKSKKDYDPKNRYQADHFRPLSQGLIKPKDLVGIPWMLAFALRSAGWYLRQENIWHKPNPMPESVTDRCTKSHESIFLFSKSKSYYYDYKSIMQDVALSSKERLSQDIANQNGSNRVPGKSNGNMKASWNGSNFDNGKTGLMMATRGGRKSGNKDRKDGSNRGCPAESTSSVCSSVPWEGLKANKRSVWTVTTKPFAEAHFATFPPDLITDCIKAGCPENGIVLDPFMGAGTTAVVSRKLNRNYIGFELNPDYITIANKRLYKELGIFI